jgi:hypothetical protein
VIYETTVAFCDKFISGRRVMVVGDGDFSFSKAVASCAAGAKSSLCTSALLSREDAVKRYMGNNSSIVDNLAWFEEHGVPVRWNVDATRLSETTLWPSQGPCEMVIWTYPFPETNDVDVTMQHALMDAFFNSVKEWHAFARDGIILVGLKSCSKTQRHCTENEDYQLERWGVMTAAAHHGFRLVSAFGPVVPFWCPTHVSGRPLCKRKERIRGQITIKFYAFVMHACGCRADTVDSDM